MSVKKTTTPAAPVETETEVVIAPPAETLDTPAPVESPQSVALELARVKRWTTIGETRIYEAGVVYEFDEDKAQEFLRRLDDDGFPIFRRERPKAELVRKPDRDLDAVTRHEHRERVRDTAKNPPPPPKPIPTAKNTTAKPIIIEDDDPEIAAKLKAIDEEGTAGAVSI